MPSNISVPDEGVSTQPRMCSSVDLPQPDGPLMAVCSPGAIATVTSRTANDRTSRHRETPRHAEGLTIDRSLVPDSSFTLLGSFFSVRVHVRRLRTRTPNCEPEPRTEPEHEPSSENQKCERRGSWSPSPDHLVAQCRGDREARDDAHRIEGRQDRRRREQRAVHPERLRLEDEEVKARGNAGHPFEDPVEPHRQQRPERQATGRRRCRRSAPTRTARRARHAAARSRARGAPPPHRAADSPTRSAAR